jgi:hypothetical protein
MDLHLVGQTAMHQRLIEALVGVLKHDILADDADGDLPLGVGVGLGDAFPAGQIGRGAVRPK